MAQYNSGRKKRFGQTEITTDRYDYLGLEQAEPDLGDPKVGVGSTGANPKPAGQTFILAAVSGYEGKRYWAPITGDGIEIEVQGSQGTQGTQGRSKQGVQGIQGAAAIDGADGNQGNQGVQSAQGAQGRSNQGTQGVQSTQGAQGLSVQGSQGLQGENVQGTQGNQGLGSQGSQGTQGLAGKPANWERKTSAYTMSDGDQIIADTSGNNSFTLTLPASPTGGEIVRIADGGDWTQYNITIARNGSTIEGFSEDLIVDIGNTILDIIYESDGSNSTWQVYSSLGAQGVIGDQGSQGIQGVQSAQGTQGLQGTQGAGSQGSQGTQGRSNQGAQGLQGVQATQGLQGESVQGSQGLQGVQGKEGAQGDQGTQGLQGTQGTKGQFSSVTYAILDPLDSSLEVDSVEITQTNSVTYMGFINGIAATNIFLFNGDTSGSRIVSTGDRRIYLSHLRHIYLNVARGMSQVGAIRNAPEWGDPPESGTESLLLQYADADTNWTTMKTFASADFSDGYFSEFEIEVPTGAKKYNGVKLRLFQETSTGTGDNWAVSSVIADLGGVQGTQGLQGAQGRAHQGVQGTQGLSVQGSQGLQGVQGVQGPLSDFQGTQGTQGIQSAQGAQGRAHQGTQGLQGVKASTVIDAESVFEVMLFT
jgi:hypothetical protein